MTALPTHVTREELATVLGVTSKTVSEHVKAGRFNVIGKGQGGKARGGTRYELAQCVQAYVVYCSQKERNRTDRKTGSLDLEAAQLAKVNAEVRIKNIQADIEESKVITIDESDAVLNKMFTAVRSYLLQIPGLWSQYTLAKTVAAELQQIYIRLVDKLLTVTLDNLEGVLNDELLDEEDDGSIDDVSQSVAS